MNKYLLCYIPYTYKFSRDVIFTVFMVNLSSVKFHPRNFFLNLVCANRRAARIHVIRLYSSEGSLGGGWRLVGANHGFHFILHCYYSGFWYIREQFRCNKLQTSLGVVGNILSEILSHVAGCNHVVNQIRVISAKFDWQVILEIKLRKSWICGIREIYVPRKFVRIRYNCVML